MPQKALLFLSLSAFILCQGHGNRNKYQSYEKRLVNLRSSSSSETVNGNFNETDFRPLSCNKNLSDAVCLPWTRVFGKGNVRRNKLVVPCGTCIYMDVSEPSLRLEKGLVVRGKLVFLDEYSLNIEASSIVVQGELYMLSTGTITSEPKIRIKMIGNEHSIIQAIGNNKENCRVGSCSVGPRSIAVAGGKINLVGIPLGAPTWVNLYDISEDLQTLIVTDRVYNRWGVGSKIVVTSSSRSYWEEQVRQVIKVETSNVPGFVELSLDLKLLFKPTTLRESRDFAVEVALLSRNILFEGESNQTGQTGHLIVFKTPSVPQRIEGVELRHFGQQGILGRYPIHFHLCGDNVAYHTAGHCFMTEDGIETGNVFIRNIGIRTLVPDVIIPDNGANGNETDGEPATYWITNPRNDFIENVAAGSQNMGFWFETRVRGTRASLLDGINPLEQPLGRFEGNVVHSNWGPGLNFYLNGYEPTTLQRIERLRVYRNRFQGVRLHRNRNLEFSGCIFADQPTGIAIDRSEEIHVVASEFIGFSDSFRRFVDRRTRDLLIPCKKWSSLQGWDQLGIVVQPENPWSSRLDTNFSGLVLDNVKFKDYEDRGCSNTAAFALEHGGVSFQSLEMMTSFRDVSFEDASIDLCTALKDGTDDFYLSDLGGNLLNVEEEDQSAGALVITSERMLRFVDENNCVINQEKCYAKCNGACFRTLNVYLPLQDTEDFKLRVCKRFDPSVCFNVIGTHFKPEYPRRFAAHLPAGQYDAAFVDDSGELVWQNQQVFYSSQEPLCEGGPLVSDVSVLGVTLVDKGTGLNEIRIPDTR